MHADPVAFHQAHPSIQTQKSQSKRMTSWTHTHKPSLREPTQRHARTRSSFRWICRIAFTVNVIAFQGRSVSRFWVDFDSLCSPRCWTTRRFVTNFIIYDGCLLLVVVGFHFSLERKAGGMCCVERGRKGTSVTRSRSKGNKEKKAQHDTTRYGRLVDCLVNGRHTTTRAITKHRFLVDAVAGKVAHVSKRSQRQWLWRWCLCNGERVRELASGLDRSGG